VQIKYLNPKRQQVENEKTRGMFMYHPKLDEKETHLRYGTFMEFQEYLTEKQILFNQGRNYGQIVFLAGGAGSGKGFATSNFLEAKKFKIRDVDEWKKAFMELDRISKNKQYKDSKGRRLGDLDLRNPDHVGSLHMAVKKLKIKVKTLDLLLKDLNARHLPNILFDITLKEMDDISEVLPALRGVGYSSRDVHIVWVLANYHVAVQANMDRERVVPDDILLQTHEGAVNTMYDLIRRKGVYGIDGAIHVILNNRENTVYWERPDGTETNVIKDFTYLTLKKEGQRFFDEDEVNQQVFDWIKDNVPKSGKTAHLWGDIGRGTDDEDIVTGTSAADIDWEGDMETTRGSWSIGRR